MKTQDILQGYSPAEQKRIVEGAYQLGITPDDPIFRMMATLGRYEETMLDLQARTEAMIDAWAVMIDQKLEKTTQSAEKMHYTVVSSAVRDEMKKIKSSSSTDIKVQGGWGLGVVSAICGLAAATSAVLGSWITWNAVSNWGTNQSVVVSRNDLKILQWAKSQEGKQMYQIILKNQAAIEACQTEDRTKGYCLIQVDK
ncbi:conserved hypothetical protein (plasmid) [Trichormus variabilis ATCC 29413]|uniref:Uncharacterized protein n=2 Tax=Anabaena variabilis TaxID=264691 RepID=Q3M2P2_TRIV2|nr:MULTISPECIES: DUF6753 family protein [Nostocaceae]ABA24744.1 conserved hypothetical protein [Trichormus variabilis ATCC 29413]MBC1217872.1 hypothetical protein [Trichormus variabilis ARAD]MBC1259177.1 hypothetical protein [Trichormus variabilis V5]MBC1270748.1 hypothetical protein [Trichormus variabilis FSR]MBC1305666.1 hypothetical protein [Trichormus variabilis N2B]